MSACVAEDFSVFREPASPARYKPVMRAKQREKTPSQVELEARLEPFVQSVYAALEGAAETGYADKFEIFDVAKLALALPREIPVPDSYVTPTGSLCFDWDEDSKNQLSIVLQSKGRIAYAAYFDGDRMHGSARFGAVLPEDLDLAVKRWSGRSAGAERASSSR